MRLFSKIENSKDITDKEYVDQLLDKKANVSGQAFTGGISAPNISTGSAAANYFQSQKFRGEGNANTYHHAVDFGYAGHNQVDFHEYGGVYNFYQNTAGTASGGMLIGAITSSGIKEGSTLLKDKYAQKSELATVATSGSYNDLSDKPSIPTAITSIDGLSGGTLTSPLKVTGGDGTSVSKIALNQSGSGQITDSGTSTVFGFMNSADLTIGSNSYNARLRGKETRPKYNGNDLALKSDVPTVPTNYVTTNTPQEIIASKTFVPQVDWSSTSRTASISNAGMTIDGGSTEATTGYFTVSNVGSKVFQIKSRNGDSDGFGVVNFGGDDQCVISLGGDVGTSGQVLTSQGDGITPKWITLSTVNNGTLTIQKNGTNVQTFSANQSTNSTANITVPETFDDLTRIKKQGYAGANNAVQYFKLATFPVYNSSGNYASLIITGRMGGWEAGNMSFVNMIVYNRGAEGGGYVSVDNGGFSSLCDIVMYRETDGSSMAYLKVSGYYTFDININTFQSVYAYTGSNVTPTGTLKWTASSQADRLVVSDGSAYVNGQTIVQKVKVNNGVVNPNAAGLIDLGNGFVQEQASNTFIGQQNNFVIDSGDTFIIHDSSQGVELMRATGDDGVYFPEGFTAEGPIHASNTYIGDADGFLNMDYTAEMPVLVVSDGATVKLDGYKGKSGQVFTSGGDSASPTWTTPPQFTLSGTTLTITV